jgi:hypothetical protein
MQLTDVAMHQAGSDGKSLHGVLWQRRLAYGYA